MVTPTHTYQGTGGQYCREYQQTIIIDGKPNQSYGTACRQPDGSWKVM
jgi:surface antigen